MATIKSYSDLQQSKKLAKILPIESADMYHFIDEIDKVYKVGFGYRKETADYYSKTKLEYIPCWSLTSLLGVLPEINGVALKIEKVKAEDGYDGYYYPIEYEGIVLIPYPKNPVDACYEMIIRLNELKML